MEESAKVRGLTCPYFRYLNRLGLLCGSLRGAFFNFTYNLTMYLRLTFFVHRKRWIFEVAEFDT